MKRSLLGWAVDDRVDLFVPQTSSVQTIYRNPGGGDPIAGIAVFRADGSAVVIADRCGSSPRTAFILEIASGRTARIDCEEAYFVASVRV